MIIALMVMLMPIVLGGGGCSTHERTYADQAAEQVWAAMVAVAEVPDYTGDWHVTDNIVTANRHEGLIDVNRSLRRTVIEAAGRRRTEQRDWQFRFVLLPEDPLRVAFIGRNPALPVHITSEANRFFADLEAVLAGVERAVEPPGRLLRVPVDPADDPAPLPGEPR